MTPRPQAVRIATPADESAVFKLALKAHEENAVAPIDEGKVIDKIRIGTQGKGGIIGIIDGPKEIEAIIMMELAQFWYSSEWHLSELFLYVHPEYRQSSHAKQLIEFSKWASEQMTIPLFIGVLSNSRTKAKIRLYKQRLGLGGALFFHNSNFKGNVNDRI